MLMHFLYRRMVKIVASIEVKQNVFNGLIKTFQAYQKQKQSEETFFRISIL